MKSINATHKSSNHKQRNKNRETQFHKEKRFSQHLTRFESPRKKGLALHPTPRIVVGHDGHVVLCVGLQADNQSPVLQPSLQQDERIRFCVLPVLPVLDLKRGEQLEV